MWPLIVAILVTVLTVAGGTLLWRWRRERTRHVNCPGCGARLAYKAKSAGGRAMCPQCGERFLFPATPSLRARWTAARVRRLYDRALERERTGDIGGAILGYTAVLTRPTVAAEWRAKALVGRAGAHWKSGSVREAFDDLEAVLHMSEAPDDIKRQATERKQTYLGRR